MQELRLVAVSEDGTYLVLATAGRGTRFTLPVDDRLRAAVRGHFSRLGQFEIEVESPLRPKEIQARIRAGETAEEIAESAGIPVERVRWFEGPVLQEREYMAQQAQRVTIRRQGESSPGPPLGEMVEDRLGRRGVDLEEIEWDSCKCEDNTWRVRLSFFDDGRPHAAEWVFDPRRRHVSPLDEEAARLSSLVLDDSAADTVTPLVPRRPAMKVVSDPRVLGGPGGPPVLRTERPGEPRREQPAAGRDHLEPRRDHLEPRREYIVERGRFVEQQPQPLPPPAAHERPAERERFVPTPPAREIAIPPIDEIVLPGEGRPGSGEHRSKAGAGDAAPVRPDEGRPVAADGPAEVPPASAERPAAGTGGGARLENADDSPEGSAHQEPAGGEPAVREFTGTSGATPGTERREQPAESAAERPASPGGGEGTGTVEGTGNGRDTGSGEAAGVMADGTAETGTRATGATTGTGPADNGDMDIAATLVTADQGTEPEREHEPDAAANADAGAGAGAEAARAAIASEADTTVADTAAAADMTAEADATAGATGADEPTVGAGADRAPSSGEHRPDEQDEQDVRPAAESTEPARSSDPQQGGKAGREAATAGGAAPTGSSAPERPEAAPDTARDGVAAATAAPEPEPEAAPEPAPKAAPKPAPKPAAPAAKARPRPDRNRRPEPAERARKPAVPADGQVAEPAAAAAVGGDATPAAPKPARARRKGSARGKRASVPSWDEIMFGARRPE